VHKDDVVIAISNSGDTRETCAAVNAIKEHGAKVIAVTGRTDSELAKSADLVLHARVEREGGTLGLAPRVSVLGQIYVLAALSVALESARGLTVEQYSKSHRAGVLGVTARKLTARLAAKRSPRNLHLV
jgi:arabinose-5-phosphate isomerase